MPSLESVFHLIFSLSLSKQWGAPHAATVGAVNHNYIVNERFTYDHAGRLVNSYHKMGDTGTEVRVVNNTYNELGQLAVKKMHESATANTFLQDVDYTYNIRGWIEQINDFNTAADLFALKLTYKEGDAALDAAYAGGANANYNGNITMLEWKASGSATRRVQGFRYDGLNRLSNVQYAERNGGTLTVNQNHNETLTYDDNGNILGLTRRGLLSGTSTFGLIDNLTYSYTNNRLSSIAEGASTAKGFKTGGAYGYDANGNMTTDAGKGMTVSYNFLNLPQYIAFNSGSEITLTYTATGQKLTKVSGTTTKHYANGIEYNNTALEAVYFAEGRVVPGSPWKYQYTLKDHLGNGRVWFEPNSTNTAPVVTQQSHYYAFGMEMEALTSAAAPNKYRYNGKELNDDFGLNWHDYGARWYDAALGRWWSVDPMAEKYVGWSGYNYTLNNPITFLDPNGMWVIFSGSQEQKDLLVTTLNNYIGIQGIFSINEGGLFVVKTLSDEQKKSLSAIQKGFYDEAKFQATTTQQTTDFQLVTEGSLPDKDGGESVNFDAYNASQLDPGDFSMAGEDVGNLFTHAIFEQSIKDNQGKFQKLKIRQEDSGVGYEQAHEYAMKNDIRRTGYTFVNEYAANVNDKFQVVRDAVNGNGNVVKSVMITYKSRDNQTVVSYDKFDRYSNAGKEYLEKHGFTEYKGN